MPQIFRNIDFATGSRAEMTIETVASARPREANLQDQAAALRGLISDLEALKTLYKYTAEQAEKTAILADTMIDPGLKQSLASMAEGSAQDAIFLRDMITKVETLLDIGGVA